MRLFILGILALTAPTVSHAMDFANAQPAPVQYGPLDIDENSVRVVASRPLGGQAYEIIIQFKTLPKNTREENFAGLTKIPGLPKFQALYAHQGQPFQVPGKPRIVAHQMIIKAVPGGMPLEINGAKFAVVIDENGSVELQKLTHAKR